MELADVMEDFPDLSKLQTPRDTSRREVSFDVKAKKTAEKLDTRTTPKSTPG